jgi:hypothetical protein
MTQANYRFLLDLNQDAYYAQDVSVTDDMNLLRNTDRLAYAVINSATSVAYDRDWSSIEQNYYYSCVTGTTANAGIRIGGNSSDGTPTIIILPSAMEVTARITVLALSGIGEEISFQIRNLAGVVHSTVTTAILTGQRQELSVTYTTLGASLFLHVWRSTTTTDITFRVSNILIVAGASTPTAFNTGNGSDAYEDITDYVLNAQWSVGMSDDQQDVAANPTCNLLVDNLEGWFNQDGVGAELVTNGDFGNWTGDDPDGWTLDFVESGTASISEVGFDSLFGGDGTGSANFKANGPGFRGISQDILTIGQTYLVSFDIGAIDAAGVSQLGFYSGDNPASRFYSAVGHFEFVFVATDTPFVVQMNGVADITVDNISVKACPRYYGLKRDTLLSIHATGTSGNSVLLFRGRFVGLQPFGGANSARQATLQFAGAMDELMRLEYKPENINLNVEISHAFLRMFANLLYIWPYTKSWWVLGQSFLGIETWLFDGEGQVLAYTTSTVLAQEGDIASNREKGVSVGDYTRDLMAAEFGGRFYMNPYTGQAVIVGRNSDYSLPNIEDTLTDDDYETFEYSYADDIINSVVIWFKQRRQGDSNVVLWESESDVTLPPGTNKRITGRFRDQSNQSEQISALTTEYLARGVDYTVTPNIDTVLVTVVPNTQSATFTIQNEDDDITAVVSGLQIRGTPIYALTEQSVIAENLYSIYDHNVHEKSYNLPLISSDDDALALASGKVALYGEPFGRLKTITFSATKSNTRYNRSISIDLDSQVTINQSTNGHSGDYVVIGIQHNLTAGGEGTDIVTWVLKCIDRVSYWYLGTAGRSELGITTNLAF